MLPLSHHLPIIEHSISTTFPQQLLQLVADQRWVGALQFVRQHRSLWPREASSAHDEITIILNTYCTYLADKKPGVFYSADSEVCHDWRMVVYSIHCYPD